MEVVKLDSDVLASMELQCSELRNPPPFPLPVVAALCALRGIEHYDRPWTDEVVAEALTDLEFLMRRGGEPLSGVHRYLLYLKGLWAKCVFSNVHFPRAAAEADEMSSSTFGVRSNVEAVLTICQHLYVLKSNGLTGPFVTSGDFLDHEMALISHACFDLTLRMAIFVDQQALRSVLGGTGTGSTPSLERLRRRLIDFGKPECVDFYEEGLSEAVLGHPICVLIAADLDSGVGPEAEEALKKLPVRSCAFCWGISGSDLPAMASGITGPLAASLGMAMHQAGSNITGKHLSGVLASFWDDNVSWPVLSTDAVLRLVRMD
jgi:hypothetical protein